MKKIVFLTESELISIVKRIVEDVEDDDEELIDYDESDYHDVFNTIFKKWLTEKGVDVTKYPYSYLFKKYSKEFHEYVYGEPISDEDSEDFEINRWDINNYAREILKKKLYKIPSLRPEVKFTEKFKKPIHYFIES